MKKYQLLTNFLIIILIFFIFVFLRFYNLDKRVGFGWDQEEISYQVKKIVVDKKLTLLGPRVNNDQGFFLGPYFTYLITPFYLLSNLHPQALIYFLVFFNFLFFWLSFYLLKKIFNKKIAYFFLIFWSVNLLLVEYDITPWWPITIPLGVILVWYLLHRAYRTKKRNDYFILGLTLGFFNNMHFQFVFILLFSLFFLFFEKIFRKKFPLKNLLFVSLGYFLTFTPLLIFDLRHNLLNIKAFFQFFFSTSDVKKDIYIWWEVFKNFLQPLFFYKNSLLFTKIFYFFILSVLIFLIKKESRYYKIFFLSSLLLWLIFPLFFGFYGKRPSEYYFVFLYPFIYLTLIKAATLIRKELILIVFIFFMMVFEWNKIKIFLKDNLLGLYYKDQTARRLKMLISDKKFNISFNTPLGQNYGFSYFVDWYQIKQSGNFKDPLVEIRIPPKEQDVKINEAIGIKIPKELK